MRKWPDLSMLNETLIAEWSIDHVRFFCAFIAGTLLTLSGSLVQGITQNSLASPSTLGLNAFAVCLILLSHLGIIFFHWPWSLEMTSLILLLIVLIPGYAFCLWRPQKVTTFHNALGVSSNKFVLIGLCFNLFVGATLSIVQFYFVSYNKTFPQQLWFGNFRFIHPFGVSILVVVMIAIFLMVKKLATQFRTLAFGTNYAFGLGVSTHNLQIHGFMLSLMAVGIVTSLFGVFAFYGLIFPHVIRGLVFFKYDFKKEIQWGCLVGGLFLAVLDWLCFNFTIQGSEIPVGMISSLIGTFIFLLLLIKYREEF